MNQGDVELWSKLYNLQRHLQIFAFCPQTSQHTLKHQGKDTRAGKITRATLSEVTAQLLVKKKRFILMTCITFFISIFKVINYLN